MADQPDRIDFDGAHATPHHPSAHEDRCYGCHVPWGQGAKHADGCRFAGMDDDGAPLPAEFARCKLCGSPVDTLYRVTRKGGSSEARYAKPRQVDVCEACVTSEERAKFAGVQK